MAQKVDAIINTAWEIQGLASEGPNSEFKEKLMLFGQFVGDWDILECRYLQTDGTWANQTGELFRMFGEQSTRRPIISSLTGRLSDFMTRRLMRGKARGPLQLRKSSRLSLDVKWEMKLFSKEKALKDVL